MLHVQYTAFDGGAALRAATNGAVLEAAKSVEKEGVHNGFWAIWDLKNEFVNEWYSFSTKLLAGKGKGDGAEVSMKFGDLKQRLPFWSRQQDALEVRAVTLMSKSQTLLSGLQIPALSSVTDWDDGKIGDCFTRSCSTTETNMDWIFKTKVAIDNDVNTVEDVYLVIQYLLAGSKSHN